MTAEKNIILNPGKVSLSQLKAVFRDHATCQLNEDCEQRVNAAAAVVAKAAQGSNAVYGINTGFGKLASQRIAPDQTTQLQRNLILSHCCGVGEPLERDVVRLIIVLKLISLGRGASGVRWEILQRLQAYLELDLMPLIPAQGSVGASGDLAPLAHLAATLIGEGEFFHQGKIRPAREVLEDFHLSPIELGPKEGLGLINGTQVSCALALKGLFDSWRLLQTALISGAMSTDALMGSTAPFHAEIQNLRGLQGQIDAASSLRELLQDSIIRESHREDDERVQDPYSLRCQPQVMGACIDLLRQVASTLEIEANAVTDNPIVLVEEGVIVSGGNFHAEPVAFAADQIALALSEIGSIAERRIATAVDPAQNYGLPAFLTPNPGLNSGFMIAEVTSAALMAENKQRAMPCSVDSTPTSANQEDHVSMACHAARRLQAMNDNLAHIIAVELLIAGQGIELRAPSSSSPALCRVINCIREHVPMLEHDRILSGDMTRIADLVRSGEITAALQSKDLLPAFTS
ncbi:MAG: histidine ammonia-lyase [Luminiphilus sp.]